LEEEMTRADTANLPEALALAYTSPDGRTHAVKVAEVRDEFVFPFLEIAEALMYDRAEHMSPTCAKSDCKRIRFKNLPRARKCVTRDGLFHATQRSRTDDHSEAARGPAVHFHEWLRAVMLPLIEADHWPPTDEEVLALQLDYQIAEHDKAQCRLNAAHAALKAPARLPEARANPSVPEPATASPDEVQDAFSPDALDEMFMSKAEIAAKKAREAQKAAAAQLNAGA
jgi:hypothetical protein